MTHYMMNDGSLKLALRNKQQINESIENDDAIPVHHYEHPFGCYTYLFIYYLYYKTIIIIITDWKIQTNSTCRMNQYLL